MLTKFHALHPTGCLISELLQIYQGKYLVRVSVQIEGVTRTTGMAAAETLEMAEDNALHRALTVFAMDTESKNISSESRPNSTTESPSEVETPPLPHSPTPPTPDTSTQVSTTYSWEKERLPQAKPTAPISPTFTDQSAPISPTFTDQSELFSSAMPTPQPSVLNDWRTTSVTPTESQPSPPTSTNNVTPFISRSPAITANYSEPEDLSDPIAKIDFEMDRLGWSKEEGREYLIQTYKKKARSLLNEEELRGFLKHLESQPTPKDPGF